MGEINFAWKQIKKNLWFVENLLLWMTVLHFVVQSVNNMEYFNYMYVKPITDFIDLIILPLFAA